jgi:hypothetical protein
MAPKKPKEMSKTEGKKPMSSAIDKKKPRAKKVPLVMIDPFFVTNDNQNPDYVDEKVVGWVLTDTMRKKGAVIWYLARATGNVLTSPEAILTKVSGVGKPADFPPASLSEKDLASGRYTVVEPLPAWARQCYIPKSLVM